MLGLSRAREGSGKDRTAAARLALWTVLTTLVAAALFYLARPATFHYVASAQGRVTPFTVHERLFAFDASHPNGWLSARSVIARRSDGSTVDVATGFGPDGSVIIRARKIELIDGRSLLAFDDVSSVVRTPSPPAWLVAEQRQQIMAPPSNCVSPGNKLLGFSSIKGIKVAVVRLPDLGGRRITVWEAPGWGCQMLQSSAEFRGTDGGFSPEGETKLTSFARGDPDPTLFEIPVGYKSVMPSQGFRREFAFLGRPWTKADEARVERYDEGYERAVKGQFPPPPTTEMYGTGPVGAKP